MGESSKIQTSSRIKKRMEARNHMRRLRNVGQNINTGIIPPVQMSIQGIKLLITNVISGGVK